MTDKQIIIDGVDVHWCEHYTGNIGYLTDKNWTCRAKIQGTKCEDWSNCYFKRWQRKEELLKQAENHIKDLDLMVHNGEERENELEQKLLNKEQECEKLKSHINCICFDPSSNNNRCISYNRIAEDYERDLKQLDQLKTENEELKKQNNQFDNGINEQFSKIIELEGRNNFLKQILTEIKEIVEIRKDDINDWLAKEILQKINEV